MKTNGFKHIKCAPYHPASVEKMEQTFQGAMEVGQNSNCLCYNSWIISFLHTVALFMPLLTLHHVNCSRSAKFEQEWTY